MYGRRPDLLLKYLVGRRDLYVDVVGSSSLAVPNVEVSVSGRATVEAGAHLIGTCCRLSLLLCWTDLSRSTGCNLFGGFT